MNLNELNNKQKEAVLYNDGPLLIIAGAGAGKTKTLTTKIAYLIDEEEVSPYNILAITFTNKAAKEMKDRLYSLIGDLAKKLQVSTFHSFGLRLIRENYNILGYDRNFVTNQALRDAGVKVLEIPSAELVNGRGGPHCLSMALIREDDESCNP